MTNLSQVYRKHYFKDKKSMKALRVALVHDYLREYGGAERVLEALHDMFPKAPVYTAFVDKKSLGIHAQRFEGWDIHESSAARIPFIYKLYSPLRVFSAYFFEGFDFSDFDLVISSTNMYMAKAVITSPYTHHICYCHTPPRSLYGYSTMTDWKKNTLVRILGNGINTWMRFVDYLTAQRPDLFLANSKETQGRIQRFYHRESRVVYPPVSLPLKSVVKTKNVGGEYFLYVNRLAFAKHPEIALKACVALDVPLKIVGKGAMEDELKKSAGSRVEFLGSVSDSQLASLYLGAKAVLYPVEDEDFGIVPIEAMLAGVPVIAHNSGGPKETIVDGKTGILFDDLSVEGLLQAMKQWEHYSFDSQVIQKHAQKYSTKAFQEGIRAAIDAL